MSRKVAPIRGAAVAMLVASACAALTLASPAAAAVLPRTTSDIVSLSAGHADECALLATGGLECWGWDFYGQLGNHATSSTGTPVLVPGVHDVRQVATGFAHTCALMDSGHVSCWGWNANGQLGDRTERNSFAPVAVYGLSGVTQIAAGFEQTCALLQSRRVRCWGWNFYGQVGDGSTATRQQPVDVARLSGVLRIYAGYGHTCALLVNHTARCWGWGTAGQLGDGRFKSSAVPVAVERLKGIVQLALGYASTCALLDNGLVACWGRNNLGQLGDDSRANSAVPVIVHGVHRVAQIAAGFGHVCALRTNGTVECWGFNQDGQLGDGTRADRSTPLPTATLRGVTEITAQDDDTCALLRSHAYSCWGLGHDGELGDGHVGGGVRADALVPPFLPSSPRLAHATVSEDTAVVRWLPPTTPGAGGVGSYVVRAIDKTARSRGNESCRWLAGPLRCTVFNLHFGDTYSFLVSAQSAAGGGRPAATPNVVPFTTPDQPRTVTATPSNGAATVAWAAPGFDGGTVIQRYVATATDETTSANGGESCTWTSGPLRCTVRGLTNGDQYTFSVAAVNRAGSSSPSDPSSSVIPATKPAAPGDVTATAGNAEATVQWSQPSDGGSPITDYKVLALDATNVDDSGQSCDTSSLGCTVTGLNNGDDYTFTVTATNAVGTSVASAPSNTVVPVTVPDAPTNVEATAGDGEALVTWQGPDVDGGSPITGYKVTATDSTDGARGGETCTVSGNPANPSCPVLGLTNGDTYTFVVAATNLQGDSATSAPSAGVEPQGAPDSPQDVQVVPGDSSVTVSWTAPSSDGGSPITRYTVTASPTNQNDTVQHCTVSGNPANPGCSVPDLVNGDQYEITVVATNLLGDSAPSSAVPATPATVPDAPQDVQAQAGDAEVAVTWSAPDTDGGSPITRYTVTANPTNQNDTPQSCSVPGNPANPGCTVSDLVNGDQYEITVVATNAVGDSSPTSAVPATPATVPDAPQDVTATADPLGQSADVSWSPPDTDGGSPITSYTVTAADQTTPSNGGETCTTSGTACTVPGLTTGDTYDFTVVAANQVGTGPPSAASNTIVSL